MDASDHPKGLLSAAGSLLRRLGVRGRLLLAFLGISAFAVIAAAAAMYSFDEVGKVLGRITQQRMPAALASLELSRQAERIVTAAPAFLVAIATPNGPVGLAWAAVTGAGEYLIERSEDGVNWSQLVTTAEGIYMDTQVSAGTVYQYRARALGEAGASGTTTSDAVVTAPAAPADGRRAPGSAAPDRAAPRRPHR